MTSTALDDLQRARRPVRREIKKHSTEIEKLLIKEPIEPEDIMNVDCLFQIVQDQYVILLQWNAKVEEQLVLDKVKEEVQDKEFDECAEYMVAYKKLCYKVDEFLQKHQKRRSGGSTIVNNAALKLPKISIPKFSGEHKDWLGWWSIFKRINDNPDIDTADKFTYLRQAMREKSRAKDLIDRYPASADNYSKAIKALEERFGKKEILIDVYVRELQALMIENAVSKHSKNQEKTPLTELYDKIETYLNALDSLGTIDKSHFLFPMVESCLPIPVMRAWQRSEYNKDQPQVPGQPEKTKLSRLLEFLAKEVEGETRIVLASQGYGSPEPKRKEDKRHLDNSKKNKNRKSDDLPTAMGLVSLDERDKCIFCDGSHKSQECRKAARVPVQERKQKVFDVNGCYRCLQKGHRISDCKSKVTCGKCQGRHYEIICDGQRKHVAYNTVAPPAQNQNQPLFPAYSVPFAPQGSPEPKQKIILADFCSAPEVILPTLIVGVRDNQGKTRRVRAAIDTMSGHTYITKSVVKGLGITPTEKAIFKHAVFGGATEVVTHEKYPLTLTTLCGGYSCPVEAYDQEVIASGTPAGPSREVLAELRQHGIFLSDSSHKSRQVDILIGGDIAGRIIVGAPLQLQCGPTAIETRFGWTVIGQPLSSVIPSRDSVQHTLINLQYPAAMWELEAIGIMDSAKKLSRAEEDAATMEHFKKTVTRKEDGRYQVALPWLQGRPPLPSNRSIAEKRLQNATKKLHQQQMYVEYENIFEEWLESGIISEVEEKSEELAHFLPHRPVFKPGSSTTKVRPVFDASCHGFINEKEGPSLNDCLVTGPNLLDHIPNILLRFRQDKVAATADIRTAFLMIEVEPEDRKFLNFFWWKKENPSELRILQHNRVVFGVNCSPFLLNAVVDFHLEKQSFEDAKVVQKLRESLYVDNVAASFPSRQEYEKFQKRATDIFDEAKMDLRLWESNSDKNIDSGPAGVLGIKWDRVSDELYCDLLLGPPVSKTTKRAITSANARIYDPLGMLAPVTLVPKILMQQCWKAKLGWDDPVPEDIAKKFDSWYEELQDIKNARVPRHVGVPTPNSSLHILCDASESGYAAVAFLRLVNEENVSVKFLMARSRVSPLEKITINRLELIGCEIATRLGETVREAMGWSDIETHYWTDSTTAKAWISRDKDWGTFVGNRVKKIRARSKAEQWHHVPGGMNPADLPSRGCGLRELVQCDWWKGPTWLLGEPSTWPDQQQEEDEEQILKEIKKSTVTAVNVQVEEPWYSPKVCHFGTFREIVRVWAWIQRFVENAKVKKKQDRKTGPLTLPDIQEAEKKLFLEIQKEAKVQEDSFPFRTVKFQDELLRVETKLSYREDADDFKYPVVLPGKHYLVELLLRQEHWRNHHAGVQFLLANLRERVWITGGRRAAEKIVKECYRCRRFTASHPDPVTAPLPENRIRDAVPFEVTGVDYAGPLFLRGGKKAWIALFTCAVYRAVHLEVVTSLSTEAFLGGLRKFIARRGRPSVIYSDNGTNFCGASNALMKVDWEKISEDCSPIQWIFSPPSAPWWGGWWERLVRSMKELIVRNVGDKTLYQEELEVILCDIEATLNGRPLTHVYESDTLVPLTPALFLHGPREHGSPDLDQLDMKSFEKRRQYRQEVMRNLRQRFRKEYLGQLVQKRKESKDVELEPGDVVLIGSENLKRILWPVGVIEEVIGGRDGVKRVAKVRTKNGVLTRPVQRLYPMEVTRKYFDEAPVKVQEAVKTRFGREVKTPDRFKF